MKRKNMELIAPQSFREASPEERYERSNGCGPHNGLSALVPDHLLGLSVEPACTIHDWEYFEISNEEQRKISDQNFLINMNTIIEEKSRSSVKKSIRKILARIYFGAVRIFGRNRYEQKKSSL